jgi:hypothetical protein
LHSPTKHHEDSSSILAKEYSQREGNLPFSYHNHQSGRSGTMTKKKKRYTVLISFCFSSAADSFIKNLDGKPYNSFEWDEIASVHHIARLESDCDKDTNMNTNVNMKMSPCLDMVEFKRGRSLSTPSEKQNCAVCLEPMDFSSIKKEKENNPPTGSSMGLTIRKDVSSSCLFTIVHNHSFHTDYLLHCQDSPCPICQYGHSGLNETLYQCHICGTTERNHIYLICGVASCWKGEQQPNNQISSNTKNNAVGKGVESWDTTHGCDSRGHAQHRYDETLHAYAHDTETQHVCDFDRRNLCIS